MIWVEVTVFDILYMKKGTTGFPTTLLVTSGLQGKIWVENSARTSEGTMMSRGEFGACGNQPGSRARVFLAGTGQRQSLVDSAPVAAITRHQPSSDEQNEVHKPPDPKSPQCQQLPDGCAGVSQTEAIDAETPQEEGVEQRGYEVVSRVLYTRLILSQKGPGAGTLNSIQGSALD